MGLKCSPDYAQEVMANIFRCDVEDAKVYINDIGAFSHSWDNVLTLLHTILTKLQENGLTVNPLKCEWAIKETDWLGYWLTPISLKPWKKNIAAVIKMHYYMVLLEWLTTTYRDMWPHMSHILAPLTADTGTPKEGYKSSSISMDTRHANSI